MTTTMYRHGDVLVARVDRVPPDAEPVDSLVLAQGEATGHAHRIAETDGRARQLLCGGERYLVVDGRGASLVHEEHARIELPPGTYRVWKQREYVPSTDGETLGFRAVSD